MYTRISNDTHSPTHFEAMHDHGEAGKKTMTSHSFTFRPDAERKVCSIVDIADLASFQPKHKHSRV